MTNALRSFIFVLKSQKPLVASDFFIQLNYLWENFSNVPKSKNSFYVALFAGTF